MMTVQRIFNDVVNHEVPVTTTVVTRVIVTIVGNVRPVRIKSYVAFVGRAIMVSQEGDPFDNWCLPKNTFTSIEGSTRTASAAAEWN